MTRLLKFLVKLLCKMTDVIAKHNAMFLGRNNKLLRIRQFSCIEYGLLYNGYVLRDARGITPTGWHIPTDIEFKNLCIALDPDATETINTAGGEMKETGFVFWDSPNTGATNSSGFNGRGAGKRSESNGIFSALKQSSTFWQNKDHSGTGHGVSTLTSSASKLSTAFSGMIYLNDPAGCSIRLIKDNSNDPGIMTDYDGNVYPTVKIGDQVWMAANLMVEHYNNGDVIPEVTDDTTWAGLTSGALCAYNNNWTNAECTTTTTTSTSSTTTTTTTQALTPVKYGLLYNWYAATDARGIAPTGWRVPTEADFDTLGAALGGDSVAGTKLKEASLTYWNSLVNADNSALFYGRGAGIRRDDTGIFEDIKNYLYLWSSDYFVIPDGTSSRYRYLVSSGATLGGNGTGFNKKRGLCIRLIKTDSTNTGTMTDFDGNVYPTVTIGSQVWTTRNLIVTHYNNGDVIPEVTDNTTWAGLTTGALCAYNNDWNNV